MRKYFLKSCVGILLSLLLVNPCFAGIVLDGTDDYIQDSDFTWVTTDPITVSWWQYVASADLSTRCAWGIGNDAAGDRVLCHAPFSDNVLYWDYGNATAGQGRISTSYAAYDDKWTHICLVSSGNANTYQAIYLDGTLITSQNASRAPTTVTNLVIGNDAKKASTYHKGTITEFAIWNKVLTAPEIAQLANSRIKGMPLQIETSNLKVYYPIDDRESALTEGNKIRDLSGNGNDGIGLPLILKSPSNMTSNSLPTPYVASASSEYPLFEAFHAFDGLWGVLQYWITNGTNTGWLKIDLGSKTFIAVYTLKNNSIPEPNRMPNDWTLQGSNDDSSYTIIDTVTNETLWGNSEERSYTCDDISTDYRYFKLNITENNGDAYTQVGEMKLYSRNYLWASETILSYPTSPITQ